MSVDANVPRRTVETSWADRLWAFVRKLRADVDSLQRGANLRNSSISGGDGQKIYDDAGVLRLSIDTTGAVTAYDDAGAEIARYGKLEHAAPGEYGVEINVGGDWVRLGYQTTGWSVIQKPPTYDVATTKWAPSPHTHPGTDLTSPAPQADGSQYGWTNTVAGTEFYQVWVGNDGGFHFGRNVSSRKYKVNIQPEAADPRRVLNLQPVTYDRKPTLETLPPGVEGPVNEYPGAKNEYGLIAEDTLEHVPEVVTYYQGEVDGIRYDLLAVALLPLLRQHDEKLAEQAEQIAALTRAVEALGGTV